VRYSLNINLFTQIFKWTSIASLLWIPALFVTNKSLWVDEFLLALNFIDQDWQHLLKPLEYRQMAPIGFLLSSKCFAFVFSNQDFSYKIFPAIGWLGSWFVFKSILEHFNISRLFLWGAMALFSSNFMLLSYSYEFKQYSTDVTFALLIFLIYLRTKDKTAPRYWIKYGLLLTVSILFSNIAIVVMSALGFMAITTDGKKFFSSIFFNVLIIQAILFGLYFFSFLYQHPTENYMLQYWGSKNAFFPSPSVHSFLTHKIQIILNIVFNSKYIGLPILILSTSVFFVKGKISFFKLQNISFILLIIHLILSALKKYPCENRFLLYIIPFVLLSIASSFQNTADALLLNKKKHFIFSIGIAASILVALIYGQMKNVNELLKPKEDIKSLMVEIENRAVSIDYIIISEGAEVGFLYYRHFYPNTLKLPFGLANNAIPLLLSNKKFSNIAILLSHYSPFDKKELDCENQIMEESKRKGLKTSASIQSKRSQLFLLQR
jgi:hypothetical protein